MSKPLSNCRGIFAALVVLAFVSAGAGAAPLDDYNALLAGNWAENLEKMKQLLTLKVDKSLLEAEEDDNDLDIRFRRLTLELDPPPGFERLDNHRLQDATTTLLQLPLDPLLPWRIRLEIWGEYDLGIYEPDFYIDLDIYHLRISTLIETESDPAEPVDPRLHPRLTFSDGDADVRFRVDVDCSDFICEEILEELADDEADGLIEDLEQELQMVFEEINERYYGAPDTAYGRGAAPPSLGTGPPVVVLGWLADFYEDRALTWNAPWDAVHDVVWDDEFLSDTVAGYAGQLDSAIWTGHLLASQAFQFATTPTDDPASQLANIRRSLTGIGRLLAVPNNDGLIARYAIPCAVELPIDPDVPPCTERDGLDVYNIQIEKDEGFHIRYLEDPAFTGYWIGGGEISRDQIMGVMMGLSWTFMLVPDPDIRATAGDYLTRIVDFLESNRWVAKEPERNWIVVEFPDRVLYKFQLPAADVKLHTDYIRNPEHILAFVHAARMVDPDRYGPVLAGLGDIAPFSWFWRWLETMDPVTSDSSYFKFNLDMGVLGLLLSLEDDVDRFQDEMYAYRILRRALAHHQNPYFNAVHLLVEPGDATAPLVADESWAELYDYVLRPLRWKLFYPEFFLDRGLPRAEFDKPPQPTQPYIDDYPCDPDIDKHLQAEFPIRVGYRLPWNYQWERSPFEEPMAPCHLRRSQLFCPGSEDDCHLICDGLPFLIWRQCIVQCISSCRQIEAIDELLADPHNERLRERPFREPPHVDFVIGYWLLRFATEFGRCSPLPVTPLVPPVVEVPVEAFSLTPFCP